MDKEQIERELKILDMEIIELKNSLHGYAEDGRSNYEKLVEKSTDSTSETISELQNRLLEKINRRDELLASFQETNIKNTR